jgi:RHS repeat-associated protein
VFFEDRDGDAKIKTESMTSDPDSLEVLQRNYYYPFGMEMEGPWQAATAPRADYLYNGKELEEDLKLNWYAYGFRYYDPSIGRFTGVDPLAAHLSVVDWSPYHYSYNNPIVYKDTDGRLPIPVITGLVGAAGGLIYGLASGKSWKQTVALTAGGFVTGATFGLGGLGIAALGGVNTIGGAAAGYVMIGSGVAAGFAGNAVEQGVRIALGQDASFNGEEFAISGAFGMSEVVLGPAGDAAGSTLKNSIKEKLKGTIKQASRAELRNSQKEIARQIRQQAGPGILSKKQAGQAAKGLIQAAQEQRSATLQGVIRFTENGVDVSVSAMQTTITEETKAKVLEDDSN